MNTFSDEEMNELLKNPFVRTVNIDERVDKFWEVNRMWVPAGYQKQGQNEYCSIQLNVDKVFHRYYLDTEFQEDCGSGNLNWVIVQW